MRVSENNMTRGAILIAFKIFSRKESKHYDCSINLSCFPAAGKPKLPSKFPSKFPSRIFGLS